MGLTYTPASATTTQQPGGGYRKPIIIDERKKRTEPEPEPLPELTEADLAAYLAELQAPALMQDQIAAALEAVRAQIMAAAQSVEMQGLAVAALEAISADEAENDLLLLAA